MVTPPVSGRTTAGKPATDGPSAFHVAAQTPDPELPLLTIADLGILRCVDDSSGGVVVTITPTYSGCPALREIGADITRRLNLAGYPSVTVRTQLAPPWTTDWITADGRRKLAAAGIAPPPDARAMETRATETRASLAPRRSGPVPLTLGPPPPVRCPRCGSHDTELTAQFGATACKSLHRCAACGEPFEAVKPL